MSEEVGSEETNAAATGLEVSRSTDGLLTIRLNRPRRRNAFTLDMYGRIGNLIREASTDSSVTLVYITGTGDYFTSGNDLTQSRPPTTDDAPSNIFKEMVDAFIACRKVVVVGVNGPAIGFGVTILGLVDFVFASDSATFQTPFVKLGLCPEGCSSYVFPKLMGRAQANDVLLAGRKLTAHEALERRLLTEVFPHERFEECVGEKLKGLLSLPPNSLMHSKALVVEGERDVMLEVNARECERLAERSGSEEVMNAVLAFIMAKSSKSKL